MSIQMLVKIVDHSELLICNLFQMIQNHIHILDLKLKSTFIITLLEQ